MSISLVDHILHIRTKTWPKITFKSLLLVTNVFLFFFLFSPPNYTLHYKYSKIPLNWSPWACRRFLIKCFLILLRIGRKIYLEKWTVITFFKCRYFVSNTHNLFLVNYFFLQLIRLCEKPLHDKVFPFLTLVAMETRYKDFMETGQNLPIRKQKIGVFHAECWDINYFIFLYYSSC